MRQKFLTPEFLHQMLGNGLLVSAPKQREKSQELQDEYKASLLTPEAVEEMRQLMNEQFGAPSRD